MKFRKAILGPLVAMVLVFGLGYFFYVGLYKDVDHKSYQKIIDASTQKETHSKATQQRQVVAKDLWFTRDDTPLQLHLRSASSELVLENHGRSSEAVEKMTDVICFVQEELFYLLGDDIEVIRDSSGKFVYRDSPEKVASEEGLKPMQRIRYIESDNATYYFHSGLLVANQVNLSQYILPGHKLIYSLDGKEPIMKGRAESLEISLLSKGLIFNAKKMSATF